MKIQRIALGISILLALGSAAPVHADDEVQVAGFYGGLSLRDNGAASSGLTFGAATPSWNRYVTPLADDSSSRALMFGGYRWRNDVAVEASFNSADMYTLRPAAGPLGRRGVGLSFGPVAGPGDLQSRSWNVDLFTSWNFYRTFALYGRLGYAQSEGPREIGVLASTTPDGRRLRDGVNYGLGVRYDMNSALGLRLEYGRFGRFAGEGGNGLLPESDQVTFGVQFRF